MCSINLILIGLTVRDRMTCKCVSDTAQLLQHKCVERARYAHSPMNQCYGIRKSHVRCASCSVLAVCVCIYVKTAFFSIHEHKKTTANISFRHTFFVCEYGAESLLSLALRILMIWQ